jgi:hypothetical protein
VSEVRDPETGISIRLIRQWKPEDAKQITAMDMAMLSCAFLGHTWLINVGEPFCGVCGAPNLPALRVE